MNDDDCKRITQKVRELEIRLIGVDGTNGVVGRVTALERIMNDQWRTLSSKLDEMADARNERLRALEMRVYLICGIPAIVAATIAALKFLNIN